MSNYDALTDMGIQNPHEISKYRLRQDGNRDILTIYYKRKKGSILPTSRKYNFSRSIKTIVADGGQQEYKDVYEISPFLLRAISELDSLINLHHEHADLKKDALEEIEELEKSIAAKLDDIKAIIEELD